MRVQVYRNLHNGLISIQDLSTGVVLCHADAIDLEEANFIVREAGRQQVIREQRKNVHAFVRGKVISIQNFQPYKGRSLRVNRLSDLQDLQVSNMWTTTKVSYNPYKAPHFVTPEGDEVDYAHLCTVQSNGVIQCYT